MTPRLGKLPPQQKAAWLWYFPRDWQSLVDRLAGSGHNIVMPKGGIDDMGAGVPSLWEQWEPIRLEYARSKGVEPYLFVYSWLGRQHGLEAETNAIVELCARFLPHRVVVNAEVETDGMADAEATHFFETLDRKLVERFGDDAPALDNSSVPSWDGGRYGGSRWHHVPYEAISAATAVDWYQNYWDEADGVPGYDWQDGFQVKRQVAHEHKFVVPSWIVGKDVVRFADWANGKGYSGIAGWEAGNAGYAFGDVGRAFPHLRESLDFGPGTTPEGDKAARLWQEYWRVRVFNARILGNPTREGLINLSQYGLDPAARFMATEKAVLWSDGSQVDYFHRGQWEQLRNEGKVIEY